MSYPSHNFLGQLLWLIGTLYGITIMIEVFFYEAHCWENYLLKRKISRSFSMVRNVVLREQGWAQLFNILSDKKTPASSRVRKKIEEILYAPAHEGDGASYEKILHEFRQLNLKIPKSKKTISPKRLMFFCGILGVVFVGNYLDWQSGISDNKCPISAGSSFDSVSEIAYLISRIEKKPFDVLLQQKVLSKLHTSNTMQHLTENVREFALFHKIHFSIQILVVLLLLSLIAVPRVDKTKKLFCLVFLLLVSSMLSYSQSRFTGGFLVESGSYESVGGNGNVMILRGEPLEIREIRDREYVANPVNKPKNEFLFPKDKVLNFHILSISCPDSLFGERT